MMFFGCFWKVECLVALGQSSRLFQPKGQGVRSQRPQWDPQLFLGTGFRRSDLDDRKIRADSLHESMMMMMKKKKNHFNVFLHTQHGTTGSPVAVASMSLTASCSRFVGAVNCVQVSGSSNVRTLGEAD